jgi:transposase
MLTKDIKASLPTMPADVSGLQTMVLELHEKIEKLKVLEEMARNYELENRLLRERVHQLEHQLYGRKSEKYVLDDHFTPVSLFEDNAEEAGSLGDLVLDESEATIPIPAHKRKKKGRKPLPADLPRVEIIHDLCQEDKKCQCGYEMSRIGEESSEKLEMLPAQFWVLRHVRYKYACKHCEGVGSNESPVKLSPVPVQILPKTIATPSLLAHVFVSKFADALPFYRQEKQFLRYGIPLTRATMCTWAFHVSDKLNGLLEQLRQELLSGPLISIDETTVQVLNEPGRSVGSKSYMWVFRSGSDPPGPQIVLFRYSPSRSGDVARQFIGDYRGYVQTDGYTGYDFLDALEVEGLLHVGCWAHARRKFVDVARLYDNNKNTKKIGGMGKCGHAIRTIGKLYKIERKAREANLSVEELHQLRQDEAKPILDEFGDWLRDNCFKIPPSNPLGEAFNYAINQWPRLINYLKSGVVPIDNNLTENAIRPFVLGRKNWLFSDQPTGAHASALFYSLIETAKANGLEPYSYFLYLFDRLPYAATQEDYKQLLPTHLTAEMLIEFKKEYWFSRNVEP